MGEHVHIFDDAFWTVQRFRYNRSAIVAPGINDDASQDASGGYQPGSLWFDTVTGFLWICKVSTIGAAEWKRIDIDDHGELAGLTDDDHTQYLKEKASGGTAAETPVHTHASAAEAGTVAHSATTGQTTDDHHPQGHTHPAEGAVVVTHASTTGQTTDDHHAEAHSVASTGPHAQSGLTAGHFLRASAAAAFDFDAIADGDVPTSHSGSTHAATQAAAEATAAAANTADIATHAGLADPHTGYRLESADHSHATTGLQGGTLLAANIPIADAGAIITATDVEGALQENRAAIDTDEAALATHAGAADPHTGYRLESADHTHVTTGLQGGTVAHSALTGVGANDHHTKYLDAEAVAAIEATVNYIDLTDGGATTLHSHAGGGGAPTTVDYLVGTADATLSAEIVVGTTPQGELGGTWPLPTVDALHSGSTHAATQAAAEATAAAANTADIATHAGLADPHTGYRLESADHNHQSAGAQGGKLDHGAALNGLTDDDHTQYLLAAGTRSLSADWDAGAHEIRVETIALDGHDSLIVTGSGTIDPGDASYLGYGPNGNYDIEGLTAKAQGRVVYLKNEDTSLVATIKHESASATAANRIKCPGATDFTLGPGAGVTLIYHADGLRWQLMAHRPKAPVVTVFTANGTWTKPSNPEPLYIVIEAVGGGGGGGSTDATSAGQHVASGGGGGGGYARKLVDVADLSTNGTVTIGAAGSAGTGGGNGGTGGTTTFVATGMTTLSCAGGTGGINGNSTAGNTWAVGGSGGTPTGGDLNIPGDDGNGGGVSAGGRVVTGNGGGNPISSEAASRLGGASNAGHAYGGGGSGTSQNASSAAANGGAGAAGAVIVTEYYA